MTTITIYTIIYNVHSAAAGGAKLVNQKLSAAAQASVLLGSVPSPEKCMVAMKASLDRLWGGAGGASTWLDNYSECDQGDRNEIT